MAVKILKSGILTTIQDGGRFGHRAFGVNPNGAMDTFALRTANMLAGNNEADAAIEIHFPAPEIEFTVDTFFAICGADLGAKLDSETKEPWRRYFAKAGARLKFTEKLIGERAYLAVNGGFGVDSVLGSSSTNLASKFGGFHGRELKKGDEITTKEFKSTPPRSNVFVSTELRPFYSRFPTVRFFPGEDSQLLTEESLALLESTDFTISNNSDRMGYRLLGETLALKEPFELVTSAAEFGLIQLLPDGNLIVLMADHQTTGGYPRIGKVAAVDLPLLAQIGAGSKVAFHRISYEHAEELYFARERDLKLLALACKFV